jgi:hypothetical protein
MKFSIISVLLLSASVIACNPNNSIGNRNEQYHRHPEAFQWILYKSEYIVSDPFHSEKASVIEWSKIQTFAVTAEVRHLVDASKIAANFKLSEPKFALQISEDICLLFNLKDSNFQKYHCEKREASIDLKEGFVLLENEPLKNWLKTQISL